MTGPTESAGSRFLRGELSCPRCGNDVLEAVSDGTQTNFLCHQCWSCWHAELGYLEPVPVLTCPRCPYKGECLRHREQEILTAEDHPRGGSGGPL